MKDTVQFRLWVDEDEKIECERVMMGDRGGIGDDEGIMGIGGEGTAR